MRSDERLVAGVVVVVLLVAAGFAGFVAGAAWGTEPSSSGPVAAAESAPSPTSSPAPTTTVPSTTTTVPPPTATTTTTSRPTTTVAGTVNPVAGPTSELRTTAYCLTGRMANGEPTHVGAVASNRYKIGTKVTAWPNPWGDPGMVFIVKDRHREPNAAGFPTEFDFAMPGECDRALEWGNRRHAIVTVVG